MLADGLGSAAIVVVAPLIFGVSLFCFFCFL